MISTKLSDMMTKETLRECMEALIENCRISSTLYEMGIDISNSKIIDASYLIFERLLETEFSEGAAELLSDWVYDRVFDVTKSYGDDRFGAKSVYIRDKDGNTLVDDFDSLCGYLGIMSAEDARSEDARDKAQASANEHKREMGGKAYRHVNGDVYVVDDVCVDSEDCRLMAVYHSMPDTGRTWVLPLETFMSAVDNDKYTEAGQDNSFEPAEEQ